MWIILLLLSWYVLPQCPPTAVASRPPTVIVQAVDLDWKPIVGAQVTVKHLNGKSSEVIVERTDHDGYAKFYLAAQIGYTIEVKAPLFKVKREKVVFLGQASEAFPTAYVQFQLKLSGRPVTVY